MAINELEQASYERIKQNIENGATNELVAHEEHLGLRKVRLIRRSKSYNSYLALRRNETKKRHENTPAKPQAGKHELAQGEDIGDLLIETDDPTKAKPPTAAEIGLPPLDEIVTKPRKKKSDAELFGEVFFWAVVGFAVIGVIASAVFTLRLVF